jgi:hypothetical protein
MSMLVLFKLLTGSDYNIRIVLFEQTPSPPSKNFGFFTINATLLFPNDELFGNL